MTSRPNPVKSLWERLPAHIRVARLIIQGLSPPRFRLGDGLHKLSADTVCQRRVLCSAAQIPFQRYASEYPQQHPVWNLFTVKVSSGLQTAARPMGRTVKAAFQTILFIGW